MCNKLTKQVGSIKTNILPSRINLQFAVNVSSNKIFTASKRMLNSVKRIMQGGNIPIHIYNVPFLVVNQPTDESILGKEYLKKIGLNLHDHLTEVRDSIDGQNVEHIDPEKFNLPRLRYTAMRYSATNDDLIAQVGSAGTSNGEDTDEDIKEDFRSIVQKALDNGLSDKGNQRLVQMIHQNKNIFRIKLRRDQTAKVIPLCIKLRANFRPKRSPERTYAPKQ